MKEELIKEIRDEIERLSSYHDNSSYSNEEINIKSIIRSNLYIALATLVNK